jgi:hypothetical protein
MFLTGLESLVEKVASFAGVQGKPLRKSLNAARKKPQLPGAKPTPHDIGNAAHAFNKDPTMGMGATPRAQGSGARPQPNADAHSSNMRFDPATRKFKSIDPILPPGPAH